MRRGLLGVVISTLALLALVLASRSTIASVHDTPAARALPAARYAAKGFAQGQLDKHFAKHAAEWGTGNITKTGYLKRAQDLLGRDVGSDILGHVRANGDVLRYNAATNEFAAGAADGTIRTLFRPSDGMAYWLKQVTP